MCVLIMMINRFRGDLTDTLAENRTLISSLAVNEYEMRVDRAPMTVLSVMR